MMSTDPKDRPTGKFAPKYVGRGITSNTFPLFSFLSTRVVETSIVANGERAEIGTDGRGTKITPGKGTATTIESTATTIGRWWWWWWETKIEESGDYVNL